MKRSEEQIGVDREKAVIGMKICRDRKMDVEKEKEREKKKEKMKIKRSEMSEFESEVRLEVEKDRIKDMRDKKTEEEIVADRKKAKKGMQKYRYRKTEEEKEADRENMRELLADDLPEVMEYKKIKKKHNMRILRKNMSSIQVKKHKSKAIEGMKEFREDGRLRKYADRGKQNVDEFKDWTKYHEKNEMNSNLLDKLKPDIVQQINEKFRIEKEVSRAREKERRFEKLQFKEFRLTDEEKKEFAALRKERHESCMKNQKARDKKVILALQDDIKEQKLEYYYERELTLTEEERKDFDKLRQDIYKDFRKMNDKEKEKTIPRNVLPNEYGESGEVTKIQERESSISNTPGTKNSKKKKTLTITFA